MEKLNDTENSGRRRKGESKMKRLPGIAILAGAVAMAGLAAPANASSCTQIDVSGAKSTAAMGINPRGDIVGRVDTHGYLLRNGQFATLQFPGSTSTAGGGINARGDIVGIYNAGTVSHGFTLIDGVYASVDVPGAMNTSVSGIDD